MEEPQRYKTKEHDKFLEIPPKTCSWTHSQPPTQMIKTLQFKLEDRRTLNDTKPKNAKENFTTFIQNLFNCFLNTSSYGKLTKLMVNKAIPHI